MPPRTQELPKRGARRPGLIAFLPADPDSNAFSPLAGVLAIAVRRVTCGYRVEEFPADGGRGFMLRKLGKGSDPDERDYSVLCAAGGACACDCKGFVRWGHCKHADAVGACVARGWL